MSSRSYNASTSYRGHGNRGYAGFNDRSKEISNSFGKSDHRSKDYGRSDDRSKDYGRSDDRSKDYGRSEEKSKDYGRSDDRSKDHGRSEEKSKDYGRSDDRSKEYGHKEHGFKHDHSGYSNSRGSYRPRGYSNQYNQRGGGYTGGYKGRNFDPNYKRDGGWNKKNLDAAKAQQLKEYMAIPREQRESTFPRDLSPAKPSVSRDHRKRSHSRDARDRYDRSAKRYRSRSPIKQDRSRSSSRESDSTRKFGYWRNYQADKRSRSPVQSRRRSRSASRDSRRSRSSSRSSRDSSRSSRASSRKSADSHSRTPERYRKRATVSRSVSKESYKSRDSSRDSTPRKSSPAPEDTTSPAEVPEPTETPEVPEAPKEPETSETPEAPGTPESTEEDILVVPAVSTSTVTFRRTVLYEPEKMDLYKMDSSVVSPGDSSQDSGMEDGEVLSSEEGSDSGSGAASPASAIEEVDKILEEPQADCNSESPLISSVEPIEEPQPDSISDSVPVQEPAPQPEQDLFTAIFEEAQVETEDEEEYKQDVYASPEPQAEPDILPSTPVESIEEVAEEVEEVKEANQEEVNEVTKNACPSPVDIVMTAIPEDVEMDSLSILSICAAMAAASPKKTIDGRSAFELWLKTVEDEEGDEMNQAQALREMALRLTAMASMKETKAKKRAVEAEELIVVD